MIDALAVFDIGKTNIKLSLVTLDGRELAVRRRANQAERGGIYPHHNTVAIEAWLLATLAELSSYARIAAIVPVAHGATAALVDGDALVLPVADYEYDFDLAADQPAYESLRPAFSQTLSPALGMGLNLGRQLYWQQQMFPLQFARARHLLMYPQYWAWRLSGVVAAERSSLGCHTDLWQPERGGYSPLVVRRGWLPLMPPLRHAWETLGTLRPALAQQTGLPADCRVLCGVHDSNASLLRYLDANAAGPRIVLSTGTWVIAAALDAGLGQLREHGDMLANVNVMGQAIACMRFMGGREFSALAGSDARPPASASGEAELQAIIDSGTMALPCFSGCGGPFADRVGVVIGELPVSATAPYALASLYCALMTDYCLEQLQCPGDIVVEGSFTANPWFARILASISGRAVCCSQDSSGTTTGGWLLYRWNEFARIDVPAPPPQVNPLHLRGLAAYRHAWRAAVEQQDAGIDAGIGAGNAAMARPLPGSAIERAGESQY